MNAGNPRRVSLDQLSALTDEMAGLVRAGVPLERGLFEIGRDIPGRPGRIADILTARLAQGHSLESVLSDDDAGLPPLWTAVVRAGIRSGNLAAALEGLAETGRRLVDLRRTVVLAFVYPVVLLAIALMLGVFVFDRLAPTVIALYEDTLITVPVHPEILRWTAWSTLCIPPLAIFILVAYWRRANHSIGHSRVRTGTVGLFARWLPVARVIKEGRVATFADLLATLVQHGVPMPEAVLLAADASGDRDLQAAAQAAAERITQGGTEAHDRGIPSAFPPLLGWLILAGDRQPLLPQALAMAADTHRDRANRLFATTTIAMPIICTGVLGGILVMLHGLTILGPVWHLLYQLGKVA